MGHSLNRTSFRINQNLIIDDVTFEPGYILVSDANGLAKWKDPAQYITNDEPLDHFIGELYGGGVVVAVWREKEGALGILYEKTLIASVKDFGVWTGGGRFDEFSYFTDFTWSWSAVTNTLIGATAQYHSFGASNSLSIVSQDPSGTGAAAKCLGYTNEDLYGLGVYGDWYLPSTFEINCLANNSAIVNRVIAKYAEDKSIRLQDQATFTEIYPGGPSYIEWFGASMSLFLNTSPGYWTSTEFNSGSAYYLNMNSYGVLFATASKSNALLNVRPFRTDVKMWNDFDKVWVSQGGAGTNSLAPFEYMIVTYYYSFFDGVGRDLDTCSYFTSTGITSIDNIPVGCGYQSYTSVLKQNAQTIGPAPANTTTAYLRWGGDDSSTGKGESVLLNFQNLKNGQPTSNRNVSVELRASWHGNSTFDTYPDGNLIAIEVTTYNGGVTSQPPDAPQTIVSTGTVVQRIRSPYKSVGQASCGLQNPPLTYRPLVAKVDYNLDTFVTSVTFY
jgi:hypothetical protein